MSNRTIHARILSQFTPTATPLIHLSQRRKLSHTRQHVHALIDDEPVTEEERAAILRAEAWFVEHGGKGIPMEEVLADFGLTKDDFRLDREERGVQDFYR